ncbi:MAG TPA: hypothetical protein EYG29_03930, partial [Methylococcales bacterium]|nr:hypothetical protein [Methylococcales bacterium]
MISNSKRPTRLRAKVFYQGQNCGHWRLPSIAKNQVVFHLLLHGQCDITPEGEQSPHTLPEGDIFFIARGVEHVIQSIDVDHAENLPAKEY